MQRDYTNTPFGLLTKWRFVNRPDAHPILPKRHPFQFEPSALSYARIGGIGGCLR